MSISVTCIECGAKDRVADASAGKTIACKECGGRIAVPAGAAGTAAVKAAPPAGPRRNRDWGDEPTERRSIAKPKKSGGISPVLLIVGGVLALSCLLCTGVGGGAAWFFMARGQNRQVVFEKPVAMKEKVEKKQDIIIAKDGPKDFVNKPVLKEVPPKDFGKDLPKDLGKDIPKDFGKDFPKDFGKQFPKDFGKFPKDLPAPVPPGVGRIVLDQNGRLMPNDPIRDNKPHKPFAIRFDQGKTYVIDMRSMEFDSYLRLYDPKGVLVFTDDDGGGYPQARMRFTANQAGNYLIAATMFSALPPQGGAFSLSVREE